MKLYIVNEMLWGALRPVEFGQSHTSEALQTMLRILKQDPGQSLRDVEDTLCHALHGVCDLSRAYDNERALRTAYKENYQSVFGDDVITSVPPFMQKVEIEGVWEEVALPSPLRKVYHRLLMLEKRRTWLAMYALYQSLADDPQQFRQQLKSFLRHLTRRAREAVGIAARWEYGACAEEPVLMTMAAQMLTELYFSLICTYQPLWSRGGYEVSMEFEEQIEHDFEEYCYALWGRYPADEAVQRYQSQATHPKEIRATPDVPEGTPAPSTPSQEKTKVEKFLQILSPYRFIELPKVKKLGSEQKLHAYLEWGLETNPRACAMCEFLGIHQFINEKMETKFTKTQYEQLCAEAIGVTKNSFHHMCTSLNPKTQAAQKYNAHEYVEPCEKKYTQLLCDIQDRKRVS